LLSSFFLWKNQLSKFELTIKNSNILFGVFEFEQCSPLCESLEPQLKSIKATGNSALSANGRFNYLFSPPVCPCGERLKGSERLIPIKQNCENLNGFVKEFNLLRFLHLLLFFYFLIIHLHH